MIEVFLDTETTGVEIGACVIELAAIMVENGDIIDVFHSYAKPSRKISKDAFKAHGITEAFLADKIKEKDMLDKFATWIIGNGVEKIYAYNAQFDVRILKDRIIMDGVLDYNLFEELEIVDVAKLVKEAIRLGVLPKNGRKWSQEYAANCLGVSYNAHSAIDDVKAMKVIYDKLSQLMR